MQAPQQKSLLLYNESFKHLKQGLSFDERKNYQEALNNYIFGLELIQRALNSNDVSALSESQLSNLRKHQEMFSKRISEIEALPEFQHTPRKNYDHSQKGGWVQSLFSYFGGNTNSNDNSTYATLGSKNTTNVDYRHGRLPTGPPLPSNNQQQINTLSNLLNPNPGTTSLFQPFRKQAGPSILKISENDISVNRKPNIVDTTQDELSSVLHSPNLSRRNAGQNVPSSNQRSEISMKNLLSAPELRGVDKNLLNRILDDVVETCPEVTFEDIGGLDYAKQILRETVIFPQLRPDLFNGLRTPTRGILLHGPPGTGKTLLARCVASNVKATFFNISASSLNSKYHGEGEKIVKALFAAARFLAPSVIFIDEVDSILTSRSDSEHEASRRLKTQILIELDGVISTGNQPHKHMLVMAATNRPHELDDAALRRFPKRIYIPLPDAPVRLSIVRNILTKGNQVVKFSSHDFEKLSKLTEGYSGSDLKELCREAVMLPLREIGDRILHVKPNELRPVQLRDFQTALSYIKPTANPKMIETLEKWNQEHGGGK